MELYFVLTLILFNFVSYVTNDECLAVANCKCEIKQSSFSVSRDATAQSPGPANNSIPIPYCNESMTLMVSVEDVKHHTLKCEKVELNGKENDIKPANGTFNLYLKYPCSEKAKSSSGGGTFLLILLIIALCYLTLGVIYNFACMGARGFELIPNVSFWRDLPSLVKDGYGFVRNGMKVPTNEASSRSPDSYNAI